MVMVEGSLLLSYVVHSMKQNKVTSEDVTHLFYWRRVVLLEAIDGILALGIKQDR
jgi:hypothetical protein